MGLSKGISNGPVRWAVSRLPGAFHKKSPAKPGAHQMRWKALRQSVMAARVHAGARNTRVTQSDMKETQVMGPAIRVS
jgi:hypothetical protein